MARVGIDLSLRSTGLCHIDDKGKATFALVCNKEDDAELLVKNADDILAFLKDKKFDAINIEGLSFASASSSKDILWGNFWYLKVRLWQVYPDIPIKIVAVLSWRSPLFNKAERDAIKAADKEVKALKVEMKGMKKQEKAAFLLEHEATILAASTKYQTFLKCPEAIKKQILAVTTKDGKFDLTDAYFIASYSK